MPFSSLFRPGDRSHLLIPLSLSLCFSHYGKVCQHQREQWNQQRADLAVKISLCCGTCDLFLLPSLNSAPGLASKVQRERTNSLHFRNAFLLKWSLEQTEDPSQTLWSYPVSFQMREKHKTGPPRFRAPLCLEGKCKYSWLVKGVWKVSGAELSLIVRWVHKYFILKASLLNID